MLGIDVAVDGKPYGRVELGRPCVVDVSPGDHHVEVLVGNGRGTDGTVRATVGQTVVNVIIGMLGIPSLSVGAPQRHEPAPGDLEKQPPGWYPDGRGNRRWWSGRDWTEHVQN